MLKHSDILVVYNAPGASDWHTEIVEAILATGALPEELTDVLTMTAVEVDGKTRWIINAA